MKTAELKVLPVSVLKPAAYNPRKKLKPGDKEYPESVKFTRNDDQPDNNRLASR